MLQTNLWVCPWLARPYIQKGSHLRCFLSQIPHVSSPLVRIMKWEKKQALMFAFILYATFLSQSCGPKSSSRVVRSSPASKWDSSIARTKWTYRTATIFALTACSSLLLHRYLPTSHDDLIVLLISSKVPASHARPQDQGARASPVCTLDLVSSPSTSLGRAWPLKRLSRHAFKIQGTTCQISTLRPISRICSTTTVEVGCHTAWLYATRRALWNDGSCGRYMVSQYGVGK